MSIQNHMADAIESLPVDKNPPSHDEIQIVDTLFEKNQSTFNKIMSSATDVLLLGGLFVLFSLPYIDGFIQRVLPSASSMYILVLSKALLFMILYYLIKNLYLVRKK